MDVSGAGDGQAGLGEAIRGLAWLVPRLCGWRVEVRARARYADGEVLAVEDAAGSAAVRVQRLRYGSDGLAVVGYRLTPREGPPPASTLLYLRGGLGPHGRVMQPDLEFLGELACRARVSVLAPQYRGNDGGEGDDRAGEAEAQDGIRIVDAAAALGPVDRARLCVLGFSRGGTMALMAMRRGFHPRAVATIGCITDSRAARREGSWLLAGAVQVATGGRPERRIEEYERRSPLRWADELPAIPLFLMVGTADEVVGPWQSRELAAALLAAGKPCRLVEVAEGDHKLDTRPRERLALTLDWLREHLGGAAEG